VKKCLMALALVCAITATAVPAASAAAPFNPALGKFVAKGLNASKFKNSGPATPVYVRCYDTNREFEAAGAWRFGVSRSTMQGIWAYAMPKEKTVNMRPFDCENALSFVQNTTLGVKPSKWAVGSFATLLHEALHVQGVKNERTTECLANDSVRWSAMAFGLPKSKANDLSRVAFSQSARWTADRYQTSSGICQSALAARDWTSFIGK
jgi:hypothetical protein